MRYFGWLIIALMSASCTNVVPQIALLSGLKATEVTLTSGVGSHTNQALIPVTVDFSRSVSEFEMSDLVVQNGTISNFVMNSESQYQFEVLASTEGPVTMSLPAGAAKDSLGNSNTAAMDLVITYDVTPPVLSGLADDMTWRKEIVWNLVCSESCTYRYLVDTTAIANPVGEYATLSDVSHGSVTGSYYLHIQARDKAGNESSVVHAATNLDNTVPTTPTAVEDGSLSSSLVQSPPITFGGSTDSPSGVLKYSARVLKIADNSAVSNWIDVTSGSILSGLSLVSGFSYYVEVRAHDYAGNTSLVAVSDGWLVDATPPAVPSSLSLVNPVVSPGTIETPTVRVNGVVSGDLVSVFTDAACTVLVANGTATGNSLELVTVDLPIGMNTFYARSMDSAGNVSACSAGLLSYQLVLFQSGPQAYIKPPNVNPGMLFGSSVALSGDTMVVGAHKESSNQTTITNGTSASFDLSAGYAGAAYVFYRTGFNWQQQAYLKPANTGAGDYFGFSVGIDANTVVVGAYQEDSNATTITNGNTASSDDSSSGSGAVYVFFRNGTTWEQQAYLKPSNSEALDSFGQAVAVSGDLIVVGAPAEDSNQTTITNGSVASSDNSKLSSGAAYVFERTGGVWEQKAYLKASNADSNDGFGGSVAISGETIVVGALGESSNQTSVSNGTLASANNSATYAGAAYVYKRTAGLWLEEAYLKAHNTGFTDNFGSSVAIDVDTIVVGAPGEDSISKDLPADNSASIAGAAYVYKRTLGLWHHEAYLKAPNASANDYFGASVAVSGNIIVVGAHSESTNAVGIVNSETVGVGNEASTSSGAAYVFRRVSGVWRHKSYIKAANAESQDLFGKAVAVSGDTIVVSSSQEDSNQSVITNGAGASSDNSSTDAGAVYVFKF